MFFFHNVNKNLKIFLSIWGTIEISTILLTQNLTMMAPHLTAENDFLVKQVFHYSVYYPKISIYNTAKNLILGTEIENIPGYEKV